MVIVSVQIGICSDVSSADRILSASSIINEVLSRICPCRFLYCVDSFPDYCIDYYGLNNFSVWLDDSLMSNSSANTCYDSILDFT